MSNDRSPGRSSRLRDLATGIRGDGRIGRSSRAGASGNRSSSRDGQRPASGARASPHGGRLPRKSLSSRDVFGSRTALLEDSDSSVGRHQRNPADIGGRPASLTGARTPQGPRSNTCDVSRARSAGIQARPSRSVTFAGEMVRGGPRTGPGSTHSSRGGSRVGRASSLSSSKPARYPRGDRPDGLSVGFGRPPATEAQLRAALNSLQQPDKRSSRLPRASTSASKSMYKRGKRKIKRDSVMDGLGFDTARRGTMMPSTPLLQKARLSAIVGGLSSSPSGRGRFSSFLGSATQDSVLTGGIRPDFTVVRAGHGGTSPTPMPDGRGANAASSLFARGAEEGDYGSGDSPRPGAHGTDGFGATAVTSPEGTDWSDTEERGSSENDPWHKRRRQWHDGHRIKQSRRGTGRRNRRDGDAEDWHVSSGRHGHDGRGLPTLEDDASEVDANEDESGPGLRRERTFWGGPVPRAKGRLPGADAIPVTSSKRSRGRRGTAHPRSASAGERLRGRRGDLQTGEGSGADDDWSPTPRGNESTSGRQLPQSRRQRLQQERAMLEAETAATEAAATLLGQPSRSHGDGDTVPEPRAHGGRGDYSEIKSELVLLMAPQHYYLRAEDRVLVLAGDVVQALKLSKHGRESLRQMRL